jgi:hypothetical protein
MIILIFDPRVICSSLLSVTHTGDLGIALIPMCRWTCNGLFFQLMNQLEVINHQHSGPYL